MRRNDRKEVTQCTFEGVAADGGFVFKAYVSLPNIGWTETVFKATAYADGVMEIAIVYTENISGVAGLVSGMFSRKSNFTNLDSVILNYRNIRLQIGKSTGRKTIIRMIMKAMSMPGYKDGNNDVSVDVQTCQKRNPLRDSDRLYMWHEIYTNSFDFGEIVNWGQSLWFKSRCAKHATTIKSLKDGIVTVECIAGGTVSDFVAELRKFFVPYSNFYGVKAIEMEVNGFSIRVDEQNSDRILYLYKRSCDMSSGLWEKELQEYYSSPDMSDIMRNLLKERT